MSNLEPCPFCGIRPKIIVCDGEGNTHREPGYEENPWSGLCYAIEHHVGQSPECPIATFAPEDSIIEYIGTWTYDTREEAIEAWNKRTQEVQKDD